MITKSPELENKYNKDIYFTKSARIAFSYLIKLINFNNEDKILIPSYIGYTEREGSGVLDPIEENNVKFDFYPIEKNFNINLKKLEELVSSQSIKALLIIHYFGILHCDILNIKRICKNNNVLIIEDCAHTIYTKFNNIYLGDFGDFSFYSLHKVLPTKTGGFFKINNKLFKSTEILIRDKDKATYKELEILLKYDESKAKQSVLKNYHYLAKGLSKIDGITLLYPTLTTETYPMNLPVFINKISREEFYFKMIDKGVTLIALYYQLIDRINKEEYPISHNISSQIINFPINQDITIKDIDVIINATKHIMENQNEA